MTHAERQLNLACKKKQMLEEEARRDIHELCTDLSGRIRSIQDSPNVIKELEALNRAMELYIELLEDAKNEYDEAVEVYAEEKFNAERRKAV